ncbi:hypothetical protein FIU95_12300 [Microbulbifer sp. THAF38]|nr:hypothetical protein FIU95_12300 [Microbulbifer sp. THAF38]
MNQLRPVFRDGKLLIDQDFEAVRLLAEIPTQEGMLAIAV